MSSVTKRAKRSKKYIFSLLNINTETIDSKYDIKLVSNIHHNNNILPNNTTKITELSDLNSNSSLEIISFLDETKRLYQCIVSMIDFKSGKDTEFLRYNCYWCRHSFEYRPIGCPINYVSNKATKKYYSEVSKDNYKIKENITNNKRQMLDVNKKFIFIPISNESTINIDKKEYYLTDGCFCSFNCCKAFIKDNKHNVVYEQSDFLLTKMYNEIMNTKNKIIHQAPHWRLLREYGGILSINQFRDNFNKITYDYHGLIKTHEIFKPIGTLYEEKLKF